MLYPHDILCSLFSVSDDQFSAQKALQTVAAGQQAENLLDFDDVPSDQPSGLAATQISTTIPAAANLIAGTSSNPLDDLVSIFGNMGTTQPTTTPMAPTNLFDSQPQQQPQQQQNAFDGLGLGSIAPPQVTSPPPQQTQKQEEDLLGLF
jgi:AP-1 complex subunit beta-1